MPGAETHQPSQPASSFMGFARLFGGLAFTTGKITFENQRRIGSEPSSMPMRSLSDWPRRMGIDFRCLVSISVRQLRSQSSAFASRLFRAEGERQ
jgi:hypothetical protein